MRTIVVACLAAWTLTGCSTPPAAPAGPKQIKTDEIVRILEKEAVAETRTTHSQHITIVLKNGDVFEGTYVQAEAGAYAKDPHLFDALNLVLHIRKSRPAAEVAGWGVMTE